MAPFGFTPFKEFDYYGCHLMDTSSKPCPGGLAISFKAERSSDEQKSTCLSETSVVQPSTGDDQTGKADSTMYAPLQAPMAETTLHKLYP